MSVNDLREALVELGVRESSCLLLPSTVVEGALCLMKTGDGRWSVVVNERGEWLIDERFETESEACRFFLREVLMDPTYRLNFQQSDLESYKDQVPALLRKYGL